MPDIRFNKRLMRSFNAVPLLYATGIDRTLRRSLLAGALGLGLVIVSPLLLHYDVVAPAAICFGLGSVVLLSCAEFALRAVRCPACKLPWLQHALGQLPVGGLKWLVTFDRCPGCAELMKPRT
jgi:hypothetical protein